MVRALKRPASALIPQVSGTTNKTEATHATEAQSKVEAFEKWWRTRNNVGALPRRRDEPLGMTLQEHYADTVHSAALYVLGKESLPHDATFMEASLLTKYCEIKI